MKNEYVRRTINSWRLLTGSTLVICGLIAAKPAFDRASQQADQDTARTQQIQESVAAKATGLEQQEASAQLLTKEVEIAKTRILIGTAHLVLTDVPGGSPIQLKAGQKYYGQGNAANPIPLPAGTVVRDVFCGTGVIADDGTMKDFASAQGVCNQIKAQLAQQQGIKP
jgi:hypothetical protein